jgi:hypothetical protein
MSRVDRITTNIDMTGSVQEGSGLASSHSLWRFDIQDVFNRTRGHPGVLRYIRLNTESITDE